MGFESTSRLPQAEAQGKIVSRALVRRPFFSKGGAYTNLLGEI